MEKCCCLEILDAPFGACSNNIFYFFDPYLTQQKKLAVIWRASVECVVICYILCVFSLKLAIVGLKETMQMTPKVWTFGDCIIALFHR